MPLLGLLLVVGLFAAPTNGLYGCDQLDWSGSKTDPNYRQTEAYLIAKQKCIDSKWCVWGGDQCKFDECLEYLDNSNEAFQACEKRSASGLGNCKAYYLHDEYECADPWTHTATDRYCRLDVGTAFEKENMDECFYQNLKSLGSTTDWLGPVSTGTKSCGTAVCKWVNGSSSVGDYCGVGGDDCTKLELNSNEYCNCLGTTNCDLYPYCYKNGSTCVYDTCKEATVVPDTASGKCLRSGYEVPECTVRSENYDDNKSASAQHRFICVNKKNNNSNECYNALKATITTVTVPTNTTYRGCDTVAYNEGFCTSAFVIDESTATSSQAAGWSATTNCQLVDIGAGYTLGNGKYCTDGDRTVPPPNAASALHVPIIVAILTAVVLMLNL